MAAVLDDDELRVALDALADRRMVDADPAIGRAFRIGSCQQAFGFLSVAALAVERAGQYPGMLISRDKVDVTPTTSEVPGATSRDIQVARDLDRIAATVR